MSLTFSFFFPRSPTHLAWQSAVAVARVEKWAWAASCQALRPDFLWGAGGRQRRVRRGQEMRPQRMHYRIGTGAANHGKRGVWVRGREESGGGKWKMREADTFTVWLVRFIPDVQTNKFKCSLCWVRPLYCTTPADIHTVHTLKDDNLLFFSVSYLCCHQWSTLPMQLKHAFMSSWV